MKYPISSLLTLLLVLSAGAGAQDIPFKKADQGCIDYKIEIITPPKDVDFKIIINVPSGNIDQGIIFSPCRESNECPPAPKTINPDRNKAVDQFFRVLPFPTKRR